MSLIARRLAAQKLAGSRLETPEDAVAWLGGVQAQDYRGGKWSIGLRTEGAVDADVERAITGHRIVRAWMCRGTLHFIAADDLGWLTGLLAPEIVRGNRRRYSQLELDNEVFRKSQTVIRKAIEADGPLIRPEIKARFEAEGVPAEGQQVPYLLQRAALDGLIVSGPLRGREPVYGLVSEWLGSQETIPREDALGRLAGRYFASHGPATEDDFTWWAGLRKKDVRQAIEAAPVIEAIDVEGETYFQAGDAWATKAGGQAHLLAPFDEYLLGYKGRSAMLDPAFAKRVNAGGGMNKPAVILDGVVVGIWKRSEKNGELTIEIELFRVVGSEEKTSIEQAAGRLRDYESAPVGAVRWESASS